MKRLAHTILIAALLCVSIAPAARAGDGTDERVIPSKWKRQASRFISANNSLAFRLYEQIAPEEGNLFFSPISITAVLAEIHVGAKFETATQFQEVLGFPSPGRSWAAGLEITWPLV